MKTYYYILGLLVASYIIYKLYASSRVAQPVSVPEPEPSTEPVIQIVPSPTVQNVEVPTVQNVLTPPVPVVVAPPSDMIIIQDSKYQKYIAGGQKVTAFCGSKIALIIDENDWLIETNKPISALYDTPKGIENMRLAVAGLDKLVSAFDNIVTNLPIVSAPYNRCDIRLECAYLDGAAGLAGHGVYGLAMGPAFIVQYINSIADPNAYHAYQSSYWLLDNPNKLPIYYQHVTGYELSRNYIIPDQFTVAFKYGVNSSPRIITPSNSIELTPSVPIVVNTSSYGWINQGFVNITGCLLEADMYPLVGFNYNGYSYQWFMNYMMGHLQRYIDGGQSWENTFLYEYIQWSPNNSLDNVYSGLIAKLWGSYGKTAFLKNWFACLSLLPPTNFDCYIAADNFFIASCYGAQLNLSTYFRSTLRWPISANALSNATLLFGQPTLNMPTFSISTQTPDYLI